MSLCIKRIQIDVTPHAVTIFPGRYEDRVQAERTLKSIVMSYDQSGKDKVKEGAWWAREKNGHAFTFMIVPETAVAGGSASHSGR